MLQALLKLVGRSPDLPTSTIPEICLFVSGYKTALRFVCQQKSRSHIRDLATKFGLSIAEAKIHSHHEGTTWSSTRAIVGTCGFEKTVEHLIIISQERGTAESVLDWELKGCANLVGETLGYPKCCIEAYQEICHYNRRWGLYYFDKDGLGPHPFWANRLTIGWGGLSPIGELYPCSLQCLSAQRIGQLTLSLLQKYGLIRLYDHIRKHASQNVFVNQEGDIVAAKDFLKQTTKVDWVEVRFEEN